MAFMAALFMAALFVAASELPNAVYRQFPNWRLMEL
jgi:hypothetical protein